MNFFSKKKQRNFYTKTQWKKYQSGSFSNPYFQTKKRTSVWFFTLSGLSLGLLIGLVSFFFSSPFFQIQFVQINGAETIQPQVIKKVVQTYLSESVFLFSRSNRFLFQEEELQKRLATYFYFDHLSLITKGKSLVISFQEHTPHFILETQQGPYLLDIRGIFLRKISQEEFIALQNPPQQEGPTPSGELLTKKQKLLFLKDLNHTSSYNISESFFSPQEAQNILLFSKGLATLSIPLSFLEINTSVGTWLTAVITDGYVILFDPQNSIEKQLQNLQVVLRESIPDVQKIDYIDVRFEDRVYFK